MDHMDKQTEIGAYETKTRLSAFLRKVRAGGRFTITQRGAPVAELVPYGTSERRRKASAARQMQAFMQQQAPITGVDVKAMKEEGRD